MLDVSKATITRDLEAIRTAEIAVTDQITAETWGAALWGEYLRRQVDLQQRIDQCGPKDKTAAARFIQLQMRNEQQLTQLWQSLGLIREVPAAELVFNRVFRHVLGMSEGQRRELLDQDMSDERFQQLFEQRVAVPLKLLKPGEDDDDDGPVSDAEIGSA